MMTLAERHELNGQFKSYLKIHGLVDDTLDHAVKILMELVELYVGKSDVDPSQEENIDPTLRTRKEEVG